MPPAILNIYSLLYIFCLWEYIYSYFVQKTGWTDQSNLAEIIHMTVSDIPDQSMFQTLQTVADTKLTNLMLVREELMCRFWFENVFYSVVLTVTVKFYIFHFILQMIKTILHFILHKLLRKTFALKVLYHSACWRTSTKLVQT